MTSPHTRPDRSQQPPHTPEEPRQEEPQPLAQWDDPHADPPTEPIPVVAGARPDADPDVDSDAVTQQWTMEPSPGPDVGAGVASDVDSEAPTQQWSMPPPPVGAEEGGASPSDPPPSDPPPSGPPPSDPPQAEQRPYEPRPPAPNNNMRWIWAAAGVVVTGVAIGVVYFLTHSNGGPPAGTETPPIAAAPTTEPVRSCDYPAQVLDLNGWNLTVPTLGEVKPEDKAEDEANKSDEEKAADRAAGKDDSKKAKEINQPELATFVSKPYFQVTPTCDSVAFRAPVNGITTSGSKYPRSELREMNPDGSTPASWSSSVGAHTFVVNEAFTALPQGKPNLVGVQIHDEDDDVSTFRLEGTNLYVTEGDDTHHKLVTDKYVLGTKYEAKYVVSNDVIQAFYNGQLVTSMTKKFDRAYFKAGAYTQANCTDYTVACNGSTFGETTVYSLRVEHS